MTNKIYLSLHILSGIYAGACLSIAVIDLKFIQALSEVSLKIQYFSILLKNMGFLMAPLLVFMSILCFFLTWQNRKKMFAYYPLIVLLAILLITFTIHFPINEQFFNLTVSKNEAHYLIDKWIYWHYLRVLLSFLLPFFIVKYFKQISN